MLLLWPLLLPAPGGAHSLMGGHGGSKQDSTSPCKSNIGGEEQTGVVNGKHGKSSSDPTVALEGNSADGDNDDVDVGAFSSTAVAGLQGCSTCDDGVSSSAVGVGSEEGSLVMSDDVGSTIAALLNDGSSDGVVIVSGVGAVISVISSSDSESLSFGGDVGGGDVVTL